MDLLWTSKLFVKYSFNLFAIHMRHVFVILCIPTKSLAYLIEGSFKESYIHFPSLQNYKPKQKSGDCSC